MSDLRVQTPNDRTAFHPGEELVGAVYWKFDSPPRALELRLFWFTRGKGTQDAAVVDTVRFDGPQAEEARPFQFRLPDAPYSFSGKLVSLVWALELVAEPSKDVGRLELVMAPGAREIQLDALPDESTRKSFITWHSR